MPTVPEIPKPKVKPFRKDYKGGFTPERARAARKLRGPTVKRYEYDKPLNDLRLLDTSEW